MRNPILDFEIDPSKLQYIGQGLQRPECILAGETVPCGRRIPAVELFDYAMTGPRRLLRNGSRRTSPTPTVKLQGI